MLEYLVRVDFDVGRWFQVKVVEVSGAFRLELKMNPNTLVVSSQEQSRITAAILTAVEAIVRIGVQP